MRNREEGFSLTELMVVLLVMAVLIAIVVPTFFSARLKAENRAAQTSLRHALIAAKAVYSDNDSFAAADDSPTGLRTLEPSLTYVDHASNSTGPNVISVRATASSWAAAAKSASGNCYWIRDIGTATWFGGDLGHPSSCSGDDAAAAAGPAFP